IVSDYQMPGTNGIEFVRQLRLIGNRTPFILFTGKGREEVVIKVIDSGADSYAQKGGDVKSVFAELAQKIRNVVARTRAEAALRESEARYRSLIDNSTVGIFLVDLNGECIYSNRKWLEITSLSEEGAKGRGWTHGIHPDDRIILDESWHNALSEGGKANFEYRYSGNEKDIKWIWGDVTAMRDSEGSVIGYMSTNVDVTERKKAEQAVLEKEKAIARASSMARMGYWVWKADETEIAFSDGLGKLLGIPPGSVSNHDQFFDMVHPDDRLAVTDALSMTMLHQKEFDMEHRMVRADGSIITVRDIVEVTTSQGGRPVYMLGMVQDITESKAVSRSSREREDLYQIVFETTAEGLLVRDSTGEIILCNDEAAMMFGLPHAELLTAKRISEAEVVMEDGSPCTFDNLPSSITFRTGLPLTNTLRGIKVRDGEIRWVSNNTRPYMKGGKIHAAVVSFSDVTSRIRAERELQEKEKRFRLIAENMSDVITVLDMDLNFTYVSPSTVKLRGFTSQEVMNQKMSEIFTPESLIVVRESLNRELEMDLKDDTDPERVLYLELEEFRKDGSTMWVGNSIRIIRDDEGNPNSIVVLSRDVTERRAHLLALQEANSKLAMLSRLTRHDLMNQLQVLGGWLQLMRLEDKKNIEMRDKVLRTLDNTRFLIDFTAEYEGLGSVTPYFIKVHNEVEKMAQSLSSDIIRMENFLDTETVLADPLFYNALYNLVENAVRHTEGASYIRFRSEVEGRSLNIICEDDGKGVDENDKENIFERGVGKNTGEGLFLVRTILAITGMTIREVGIPGEGARFVITVPEGNWRK
ncbi:MAG: PAS domain S-box protein, partial [Methanomassiliicoccus sp.]